MSSKQNESFLKNCEDLIYIFGFYFRLGALQYKVQRRPPKRKFLLKIRLPMCFMSHMCLAARDIHPVGMSDMKSKGFS